MYTRDKYNENYILTFVQKDIHYNQTDRQGSLVNMLTNFPSIIGCLPWILNIHFPVQVCRYSGKKCTCSQLALLHTRWKHKRPGLNDTWKIYIMNLISSVVKFIWTSSISIVIPYKKYLLDIIFNINMLKTMVKNL